MIAASLGPRGRDGVRPAVTVSPISEVSIRPGQIARSDGVAVHECFIKRGRSMSAEISSASMQLYTAFSSG